MILVVTYETMSYDKVREEESCGRHNFCLIGLVFTFYNMVYVKRDTLLHRSIYDTK
jgi:hypothetical protein